MIRAMTGSGETDPAGQLALNAAAGRRSRVRTWSAALVLLCAGALWLQFRHIQRTLPYPRDIDESYVSGPAIRTLSTGTLHPVIFNYPSLPKYLASIGMAVGFIRSATHAEIWEVRQIHNVGFPYYDAPRVMQGARQLFALLSVIALAATGYAAWHALREPAAIFLAPLVLAASPLFFYHSWTYLNVDVVGLSFSALAIAACARGTRQPSIPRCAVIPGVAVGLATGSKYTQALMILPVLLAIQLYVPSGRRIAAWVAVGAVTVAAFLLAVPYSVIDIPGFLNGVGFEAFHYASGHRGMSAEPGWAQFIYYLHALRTEFGAAGMAAAVLGIAAFSVVDWRRAVVLLAYPVLALWMLVSQRAHFPRNLLALLPFVSMFMAYGVLLLNRWAARRLTLTAWPASKVSRAQAVAGLLLFIAVVPLWHFRDQVRDRTDSRNVAKGWLKERIPGEWTIVIPSQLGLDSRDMTEGGAHVIQVDLQGAPSGGAMNALLAQVPKPAVILVPHFGADERFPGQDLANTLNELTSHWEVMKTFGTNPVLVNYTQPAPSGDPAFDVAVLDAHRIPVR